MPVDRDLRDRLRILRHLPHIPDNRTQPHSEIDRLHTCIISVVSDLSSASQLATRSIQSFDFFRSLFINALNESSINNRTLSLYSKIPFVSFGSTLFVSPFNRNAS